MGRKRLDIKKKLNYRRGGTAMHCGVCDSFVPDFEVKGLGGFSLKKDSRCRRIGLENSVLYRVDYNAICDAFDNTERLRRLGMKR